MDKPKDHKSTQLTLLTYSIDLLYIVYIVYICIHVSCLVKDSLWVNPCYIERRSIAYVSRLLLMCPSFTVLAWVNIQRTDMQQHNVNALNIEMCHLLMTIEVLYKLSLSLCVKKKC